jgi:NADH:ubiquinone oxidoreductase subunit 6 (subunit J)
LLFSTLWLALTSALVSLLLYTLGAPAVAVIELSVGAGLVTVLFVFAFSIIGEDTLDMLTIVPRTLVWGLVIAVVFLLGLFILPLVQQTPIANEPTFSQMLWNQRGLDVLAQIVLIFSGVMGLLGLLVESQPVDEAHSSAAAQSALDAVIAGPVAAEPIHPNGHKLEAELAAGEVHS